MGKITIDYTTEFVLIEDNPDHALLTKKTVEMVNKSVKVRSFCDAESGIGYVKSVAEKNRNSTCKTRVVVFLDLNLPGMDGFDCLREIRQGGSIAGTPVVVFTT